MSSQNEYYKEYYANKGDYEMKRIGETSRVLSLIDWVRKNVPKGGKILDIGCGDMHLSTLLPEYDWTGMDLNIDKAQGKAVAHDAMVKPYPFPTYTFDAVVTSEFLEHIWDLRIVHQEAYRVLKPKCFYIVSTPNFNWVDNWMDGWAKILFDPIRPWTLEHIRHYNFQIHAKHLVDSGFTIIDKTGADAHCSAFFQEARSYLKELLVEDLKLEQFNHDGKIDQIIGRMFSECSHTVCILNRKV